MEEGNITNNLLELFPDSKGGCESDLLLHMVPIQRRIPKASQTSMMELVVKLVNGSQQLATFAKSSISDV